MEPTFGGPNYPGTGVTTDIRQPSFTITSDTYAGEAYRDILETRDVDVFLEEADLYDTAQRRWLLPSSPEGLLDAVRNIFESVIARFVVPETTGIDRSVISTQIVPWCGRVNRACPLLVVRAAGPLFGVPSLEEDNTLPPEGSCYPAWFTNMASYVVLRMEGEMGSGEDIVREAAGYARRIFRAQPNRFFVRSLVVSQSHARLVHVDRAGAQVTPRIDIHEDPWTFVRVVAGLCSRDERVLGLGDSVQWTIDAITGRNVEGALNTTTAVGSSCPGSGKLELKTYEILETIRASRGSIFGRGIMCWRVQSPDSSEEYPVKEAWRSDVLVPEYELLEPVKRVPGVVQMVGYETGRDKIKEFRCQMTPGLYQNAISGRTVSKAYGRSVLGGFTSAIQLLGAIRDAIAGHQRLYGDGICVLHRDISCVNVLLGEEGAPIGERGVLMDLDLAFRATDAEPTVQANHNIGTRNFQSMSVLQSSYLKQKSLPHDHIDELESFFYLLFYILLLFKPDGTRVPSDSTGPAMVCSWGAEDPEEAEHHKAQSRGFGSFLRSARLIEALWGSACAQLFREFRKWIITNSEGKSWLFDDDSALESAIEHGTGPWQIFHSHRDEHYAAVLRIFDEAIDEIGAPNLQSEEAALGSTTILPSATAVDGLRDLGFPCPQLAAVNCPVVPIPEPAIGSPSSPESTAAFEVSEPPKDGDATPFVLPSNPAPSAPAVPAPSRLSARTQGGCLQQCRRSQGIAVDASQSPLSQTLSSATEPRRSGRIQKRRRMEGEEPESEPLKPKSKLRRTTKGI